jgi:hypothetical protein
MIWHRRGEAERIYEHYHAEISNYFSSLYVDQCSGDMVVFGYKHTSI